MTRWIEDWFGSEYYCLLYKHRGTDEAHLFLDNLTALLKLPLQSRILDCGCGRGRHAIRLAEKGFDVTGIDLSEKNIAEAKRSERNNLTFYLHDKRNPFRINYYDAVLSLFTSFGYFEKDSENNKAIRSMAAALKQGGWVVLDFMNTAREIRNLVPEENSECAGVRFHVKRYWKDDLLIKDINVNDHGKSFCYSERVKAYTQAALENFFTRNRLEVVHLFGDYHLHPFEESRSERLILIGKKKL